MERKQRRLEKLLDMLLLEEVSNFKGKVVKFGRPEDSDSMEIKWDLHFSTKEDMVDFITHMNYNYFSELPECKLIEDNYEEFGNGDLVTTISIAWSSEDEYLSEMYAKREDTIVKALEEIYGVAAEGSYEEDLELIKNQEYMPWGYLGGSDSPLI